MTTARPTPQAEFAAALLDPALACPPGLRAWNGSDPAARLAVHRNNVLVSLLNALADTFPVVQALVGVAFFRAMAAVYVRQSPPRSRLLARYGEDFADFIERFEPAASVPCLPDMARLEMARVRAFHAADAEALALQAISPALARADRVGQLRLGFHPSVSVLRSRHAVISLWAAHQDGGELGSIDPDEPEDALVLRSGLDVLVLCLPPGAADFIDALLSGRALADAAAHAMAAVPAFDVSAGLALLVRHGALVSVELPV